MNIILENTARKKMIWVFVVAFWLIPPSPVFSASQGLPSERTLTFKDFYKKVLDYYPKLKRQEADVNLAIARKVQAVSGFMPGVQLNASVLHGDDPVYVFGAKLRENEFSSADMEMGRLNTPSPHTSYNATLTGQVPIFDAMQTILRVQSTKLLVDSARDDSAFMEMEAFLVACEAYLRAVAIEKLLSTVTEVSKDSEEDVRQAEDLKNKGLILGADFYTARVVLGNIHQLRNQLVREKQASRVLLNVLMGEDPFQSFEIQGALQEISRDGRALEDWIETALTSRPDLAAMDKAIQAQGIEVSREKWTALPRVDSFAEARQDSGGFSSDGGQNFLVGVKASVDLFDPSHSSRVKMSKEELKKWEYQRTILKDSIITDVTSEFAQYQIMEDNRPVMREMLQDSQEAVDLMRPLYREGRKSIADLLQIRSSYLSTAREFYALSMDSKASWTRLLFLSGQLGESDRHDVVKTIGE